MPRDRRSRLRSALLLAALALVPNVARVAAAPPPDDFIVAVANDRATEVRAFLQRGVDPNAVDANGEPALVIAARGGFAATTDVLLAGHADVELRNRYGDTALMIAALNGHLDVVKKLRARGAGVNRPGWTALIYAATGGHDDVVRYLLAEGADLDAPSANGTTALMMAVREGRPSTVELLVARGADVNRRNQNGATALAWAKRNNDAQVIARLQRAGARD
jgi:uncharacterized protein